jgi:putative heme-binding domain-containing protein
MLSSFVLRTVLRIAKVTLCVVCLLIFPQSVRAQDTANGKLPVRDGLVLWMDAAQLGAGAGKLSADGKALGEWKDAGSDRVFSQPDPKRQPRLMKLADTPFVRFDGEDDSLRCIGKSMTLKTTTVFVVAAPHANPGDFRGIFAANAVERRDYESGLAIDLGPGPSFRFESLNVEGSGFGGAADVLNSSHNFGTLHVLETIVDASAGRVSLKLDGKDEGNRPFKAADLSFEQLTIGSRCYTNGPGAQEIRGPFRGDIAEIIVFDRAISTDESKALHEYLSAKYKTLSEALPKNLDLPSNGGVPLVKIPDAPLIQMLQPGFIVQEVCLELTNINNVRYRADGKLYTLGYNGNIHLLSDTNGDGIEDKADLFWKNEGSARGPIGMLPTPPGYAKGEGVFFCSKGKMSLVVDKNGDDKADEEIIVASGWKEIAQNVDALGPAMDKEGNLYFGLGTVNYANAYLVNDDGKAEYDLNSVRGTVQKVSADFSKRETVCTGIRFPIAFAFNEHGDLFCTEQEGATWLPNGNPLDEFLHIRLDGSGPNGSKSMRHYGFPPRHTEHNPSVIDEPSTFDFGPQHQSTCGFVFNQSVNGGPAFGPVTWHGDAIVCGESRGKLWRTKLHKTETGYVASSQLLAALQMLTVDCCVAPNGDLVVACHSGPPDWGTGPTGIGKLFHIRMSQPETARPVAAWSESSQEIRVIFDRPVDATQFRQLADSVRVQYGEYVRAADRLENLVPPYAVVQAQLMQPRYDLAISSAGLTTDLQMLVINTEPMTSNVHYAVTIPFVADNASSSKLGDIQQRSEIDVDFALHGLQARWIPVKGNDIPPWSGWLPHPDLNASRELLVGSGVHEPFWAALKTDGVLRLQTRMNVRNILRPAIQPGAKIDYEWPAEEAVVTFTSNRDIAVQAQRRGENQQPATEISVVCDQSNIERQQATFKTSADLNQPVDVMIEIRTGASTVPQLTAFVQTNEDSLPRPLQLHRFLLPWAETNDATKSNIPAVRKIAEIEGGSWARGRRVFRSEKAGCFKCHAVGGGGAKIGPDLVNMVHRDYSSLLRDMANPSFTINPDYIGHVIALKDGRVLTGVVQPDGDHLLLGDEKGTLTRIAKSDIEEMSPSKNSIMPRGLIERLSESELKDLMTYLLTSPPHMPLDSPLPVPPMRTQAEVTAALAGAPEAIDTTRTINLVLVDGVKDHGPGEHDYPAWRSAWEELLSAADNVAVSTAREFPSDEQLAKADVVLFFQKGSFADARPAKLDQFLARGGGAVYIHWAVNGDDEVQEFAKRIGLASWGGRISYRHGPLTLDIHNTDHPVVRNFDQLSLYDESYWKLTGQPSDITLLATSTEDGTATPQMWTKETGKGRVFVSIPGHYNWTFDDPLFRILLLRGIAWSAHESVDRFNDLVPIGARMTVKTTEK